MACFESPQEAAAGAITGLRLANASSGGSQGNVEVQLAGVLWTPLYGDQSGGLKPPGYGPSRTRPEVAGVVCRTLGFRSGLFLPSDAFGRSSGPFAVAVEGCTGEEASLAQCQLEYGGSYSGYTASVACFNGSRPAGAASPTGEQPPECGCGACVCRPLRACRGNPAEPAEPQAAAISDGPLWSTSAARR